VNDAELIDRVAARMWEARWSGSPFSAKWEQASPEQQRDYRTMARAAIECILSGEVEGDELARRGGARPVTGLEPLPGHRLGIEPQAGEAAAEDPGARRPQGRPGRGQAGQDAGRQPFPSTYTPKGTPPVVDPRTPDDWDGGDVPPRDDDGLTAWERETLAQTPEDAADAAREAGRAALADIADDEPERSVCVFSEGYNAALERIARRVEVVEVPKLEAGR